MLRTVHASRYVLPLREGGSVPVLVEGDDLGMYVVKLRGAAQGPKALVAELIAGELARAAGLAMPELVFVELDASLADSEPDPELSDPLEASAGLNIALDYLPGSIRFAPAADPLLDASTASRIVLFDALMANIDRTPRNPNLLVWHSRVWLIDHGAALYFHHGWSPSKPLEGSADPFGLASEHVLLKWATALDEAATHLRGAITDDVIARVVAELPAAWLGNDGFADVGGERAAYVNWLAARMRVLPMLVEEVANARAAAV